jgi:hypothetical protein
MRFWFWVIVIGVVALVSGFAACDNDGEEGARLPDQVPLVEGEGDMREFVEYLDVLVDKFSAKERVMPVDQQEITAWSLEVLPYFAYERLVNYPVMPDSIAFTPYLDGMMHNHILGRAQCTDLPGLDLPKTIEMNLRTANPRSAWYGKSDYFLPTLIHELIHIQGVCGDGELSETSTQVVTLEVLASLVNHGNRAVLYPLLLELRDMALAWMNYEAFQAHDDWIKEPAESRDSPDPIEEYAEFRATIVDDAFGNSRWEKARRFWGQDASHQSHYRYILKAYNWGVFEKLLVGFKTGEAPELYVPDYTLDRPGSYRVNTNYPGHRDFPIDDLIYVLKHAAELVEDR